MGVEVSVLVGVGVGVPVLVVVTLGVGVFVAVFVGVTVGDIGVGPDIVDPFTTTVKLIVVLPVTLTCGLLLVRPWSPTKVWPDDTGKLPIWSVREIFPTLSKKLVNAASDVVLFTNLVL